MIIDSHCHLDYEPMFSNLNEVIKKAKESNVRFMLTISVTDKKYETILDITNKFPNVYGTYGIHPHEAKNHSAIFKNTILKKLNMSKKIIGIGETGLDFYYNHSDKKDQVRLFEEHIQASIESNLPLVVHSREAEDQTYEILANYSKKDINWLVPHQANIRILQATAKKLDMTMDKVIVTINKHGNTSAASIPLALNEGITSGRIKKDHIILMEAFGGGFTWGSSLIKV